MNDKEEISFEDLMKVDYVRRHILKYVMKFSDIESLTKSSEHLGFLIDEDRIERDSMWFYDSPSLTVKCKRGLRGAHEIPVLERLNIIKNKTFCKKLEEGSRYYGETFIVKNETWFYIKLDIGTYIPDERMPLVQKIAEEFMFNHKLRSDIETLTIYNTCDRQQRSLLIECISYMNHGSVKRIGFIGNILKNCQCLRNPNVWVRNMFDGFPNLNEVVFYTSAGNSRYYGSFGNGSTIKYIIKSLARKRNGTIIFKDVSYNDNDLLRNIEKIYGFCYRHGVRIKLEFPSETFGSKGNFITIASHGNIHFVDLKIIDDIKDTCLSNLGRYSLRNCRKLKKVVLCYFEGFGEYTKEMLENNLIFLASLMPDTVERLKISGYFNLSSRITDKLNECMPNIKLLTFYDGEIKNSDCLNAFRNLELFITEGKFIFEIPKTIKFIIVDHRFFNSDDQSKNIEKELVKRCRERFLKYSCTNNGLFIYFFNDITQWSKYKSVVQECL